MKSYQTLAKENELIVRKMYEAFQQQDVNEMLKYISQDVILTVPGTGLNSAEYWYHDGVKKFMSNILSYYGGKFTQEITAFAASDKHVFVREFNVINRKADPALNWQLPMVMMYTLRDGMISQMRVVPEYMDVYNAFWTIGAENPKANKDLFANGYHPLGNSFSEEQHDFMMHKYHGFWKGQYEVFKPVMDEKFEFFLPGDSLLAGSYKGYDGYLEFRKKLQNVSGDKYQLMIEAFAASDTDVFVLEHLHQNTIYNNTPGEMYVLMHFIVENGMLVRANDFPLDVAAYEKFYGKKEGCKVAWTRMN
jgi:ketosteroid isomerase-like protein